MFPQLALTLLLTQQAYPLPDPVTVILAREGCTVSREVNPWGCTDVLNMSRSEARETFDRLAARDTRSPAEHRLYAVLHVALGTGTTVEDRHCLSQKAINKMYGRERVTGKCEGDIQ